MQCRRIFKCVEITVTFSDHIRLRIYDHDCTHKDYSNTVNYEHKSVDFCNSAAMSHCYIIHKNTKPTCNDSK